MKHNSHRHEIVIEEDEDGENGFGEPMDEHSHAVDSPQIHSFHPTAIKFNKEKLLHYALQEKHFLPIENIGHRQSEKLFKKDKPQFNCTLNQSYSTNNLVTSKSQHLPYTSCNVKKPSRLRTECDKENQLLPLLPKVYVKSSRNAKESSLKKNFSAVLKPNQTQAILIRHEESPKRKESVRTIKSRRSADPTRRPLQKSFSLSKMKSIAKLANPNDQSSPILDQLSKKQQMLNNDKSNLERRISSLKQAIDSERALLEQINRNSIKLTISQKEKVQNSKLSSSGATISKRKHQQVEQEARKMNEQLQYFMVSRGRVQASIQEEKELIGMYQAVIEEVKDQLRLEKQEKNELGKELAFLKKTEQTVRDRVIAQQASNAELFRTVYTSLHKWR